MFRNFAIDDVRLLQNSCPNTYDCDFESKCGWRNVINLDLVQLTWIINSGPTPSASTGPQSDQTGSSDG